MKKRNLDLKCLKKFETYMRNEEKSAATIEKYMRDLRVFLHFSNQRSFLRKRCLNTRRGS